MKEITNRILITILIIMLSLLLFASNSLADKISNPLDHIVIFYNSLDSYKEQPDTKFDIFQRSNHLLYVKNLKQMSKFKSLIENIIDSKLESNGLIDDIHWLIGLVGADDTWDRIYIDRKGNFEYINYHTNKTLIGRMKNKELYDLSTITENLINIVDLRFQGNHFICGRDHC